MGFLIVLIMVPVCIWIICKFGFKNYLKFSAECGIATFGLIGILTLLSFFVRGCGC